MMPSKPQQVMGIIPISPFTMRPNSLLTKVFMWFQKQIHNKLVEHALAILATPIMLLETVTLPWELSP
jgi:hypothetical protein